MENDCISLNEILEVRGCGLQEDEVWAFLCQTAHVIEDLFLNGLAHKNGIPLRSVTSNTLLCTQMGNVVLLPCSIEHLKENFSQVTWFGQLLNGMLSLSDHDIQKVYVYMLGKTMMLACSSIENSQVTLQEMSSVLQDVLRNMNNENMDRRMSLSDLIQVCHVHDTTNNNTNPPSYCLVKLYQDFLDKLKELKAFNPLQTASDVIDASIFNFSPNGVAVSPSLFVSSIYDNCNAYGYKTVGNAFGFDCNENSSARHYHGPRERWKIAFLKICETNRIKSRRRDVCFDSLTDSAYNNNQTKDSVSRTPQESEDEWNFQELSKINGAVDVNANHKLINGFKHMTPTEMLFHCPSQLLKSFQRSSLESPLPIREALVNEQCASSNVSVNNSHNSLRKSLLTSNLSKAINSNDLLRTLETEDIEHSTTVLPIVKNIKPLIFLNLEPKVDGLSKSKSCSLTVILLSSQRINLRCNANISGKELFNLIAEHLQLQESHLFGLAVHRDGEYLFIDGCQRVNKLISSLYPTLSRKLKMEATSILTLYLRIKFYLFDVQLFRHQDTRDSFYLQLRKDILDQRIRCDDDTALLLGALTLQADCGDLRSDVQDYFNLNCYLPAHIIRQLGSSIAVQNLSKLHSAQNGVAPEIAKLEFLQKVCELPEYGYHFHLVVKDRSLKPDWLGIDINGISVFEQTENERSTCHNFPWHKIQKLTFTREYFCLISKSSDSPEKARVHHFYASEPIKSRCLYQMAVCHHQFIVKLLSGGSISQILTEDANNEGNCCIHSGPSSLGSCFSFRECEQQYNLSSFDEESLFLSSSVGNKLCERSANGKSSEQSELTSETAVTPLPLTSYQKELIKASLDLTEPFCKSSSSEQSTTQPERVNASFQSQDNQITVVLEKAVDVGLGLILTCSGESFDGTYVESVVSGSPADHILLPGDQILNLNGENVEEHNFLDVVDMIQEIPASSSILITIRRNLNDENSHVLDDKHPVKTSDIETISMLPDSSSCEDFYSVHDCRQCHESVSVNGSLDKDSFMSVEDLSSTPPLPKPRKKWAERGKTKELEESNSIRESAVQSFYLHHSEDENESRPNGDLCKTSSSALPNDVGVSSVVSRAIDERDLSEMCQLNMDESVFHAKLIKIAGSLGFRITQEENVEGDVVAKGVFVHSLIPGGAAFIDGTIKPGDKLLEVNGAVVDERSYPEVVSLLKECPPVTHLVFQRCQQSMIAKWGRKSGSSSTEVSSLQKKNISNSRRSQESNDRQLLQDADRESGNVKEHFTKTSESHPQRILDYWNVFDVADGEYRKEIKSPTLSDGSSDSSCAKSVSFDRDGSKVDFDTTSSHFLSPDKAHSCENLLNELKSSVDFSDVFLLSGESPFYGVLQDENGNQAAKYHLDNSPDESGIESDAHSAKATDEKDDKYFAHHILPNVIVTPVPKQRKKVQSLQNPEHVYKCLHSSNTFEVTLRKSTRGLGFSIFGGVDNRFPDAVCQLIRIRKIYPLQPAVECGQLQVGDVILEVNGLRMLGLTHTEALETLRIAPTDVILKIFRPDPDSISPVSDFVKDASPSGSILLSSPPSSANNSLTRPTSLSFNPPPVYGEFEVTLNKVDGSLGFSVLYHKESCRVHDDLNPSGIYVKALIRHPAKSDGRIQPGDRILNVNGVDVSDMSHAEAVNFLRSASDTVTLKLYRSADGLSPLSLQDKRLPPKALRQEAKEIVNAQKNNKGSPRRLRDRRRKRANSRESASSASGSDCSNFSPPASAVDDMTEAKGSAEDINKGVGLNRNSRPKSLDVLSVNERKQSSVRKEQPDEEDAVFHRQSSILGTCTETSSATSGKNNIPQTDGQGLLKWRGFTLDTNKKAGQATRTSDRDTADEMEVPPVPPRRLESLNSSPLPSPVSPTSNWSLTENKVKKLYLELDRGWHGRLGFSLRDPLPEEVADLTDRFPVVKAVYPGSLAFNDGRIKEGDRLVEVNGESMCDHSASRAIDILRKTRGKIGILLHRLDKSDFPSIITSHNPAIPS